MPVRTAISGSLQQPFQALAISEGFVLVTGANRGIGLAFARELLARGARKIYAGARDSAAVVQTGVQPLRLDVTKSDEVAAAAERLYAAYSTGIEAN